MRSTAPPFENVAVYVGRQDVTEQRESRRNGWTLTVSDGYQWLQLNCDDSVDTISALNQSLCDPDYLAHGAATRSATEFLRQLPKRLVERASGRPGKLAAQRFESQATCLFADNGAGV